MDKQPDSYFTNTPSNGSINPPLQPSFTDLNTILLNKALDGIDIISQNQQFCNRDIELLISKLSAIEYQNNLIDNRLKSIEAKLETNNASKATRHDISNNYTTPTKSNTRPPLYEPKRPVQPVNKTPSKSVISPKQNSKSNKSILNTPSKPASLDKQSKLPPQLPPLTSHQINPLGTAPIIFIDDFFTGDSLDKSGNGDKGSMLNPFDLISEILGNKKSKAKPDTELPEEDTEEEEIKYDSDIVLEDLGEITSIEDLIKIGESVKDIKENIKKKLSESDKLIDEMKEDVDNEINKKPTSHKHLRMGSADVEQVAGSIPGYYTKILNKMIIDGSADDFIGDKEFKTILRNGKNIKGKNQQKDQQKDNAIVGSMENGIYKLGGKYYSFNLDTVEKLVDPLNKLSKMVGMKMLKDSVLDQIIYYLQNFESKNKNMLHTVIEGPPGVGKTEVAKILCKIFVAMGAIEKDKIVVAHRKDLVGEYVGHTAPKVDKIVKEAEGGVLFIDEAYGLGGGDEKRDTFSREAINTLTQLLSEKKGKFICIIAGYPEEMEKHLFSVNPGMQRRFPYRHRIDTYSPDEMKDIFMGMVNMRKWKFDDDVTQNNIKKFFEKNKKTFPYYGGDIENLFMHCRNSHSRRVSRLHPKFKKRFNMEDIENGYKNYVKNIKKNDSSDDVSNISQNMMYV